MSGPTVFDVVQRRFLETGRYVTADVVAREIGEAQVDVEPVLRDLTRRGLIVCCEHAFAPSRRRLRQYIVRLKAAARGVIVANPRNKNAMLRARATLANLIYAGVDL